MWGSSIEATCKGVWGQSHPYENSDLMAQNNASFFYISISILLRRFIYMYQLLSLIATMPSTFICYGKLNITQLIDFLNNILLNNFKWQSVNARWIFLLPLESHLYLPDSIITVDVNTHGRSSVTTIQKKIPITNYKCK